MSRILLFNNKETINKIFLQNTLKVCNLFTYDYYLNLMPTKLDRVQVLFQKDVFKKLKLLAKLERRSLSSMAGSLVEHAIESQKYQFLLSKAKSDDLKSKVDETKVLINDVLKPNIANDENFDVNSKLKKIDDLLTLISKSNVHEQEESLKSR